MMSVTKTERIEGFDKDSFGSPREIVRLTWQDGDDPVAVSTFAVERSEYEETKVLIYLSSVREDTLEAFPTTPEQVRRLISRAVSEVTDDA